MKKLGLQMQSSEGVSLRNFGLLSSYLEPHISEEDDGKIQSPTDIRASFTRKYKIKQEKPLVTTNATIRITRPASTYNWKNKKGSITTQVLREVPAQIMYEFVIQPV